MTDVIQNIMLHQKYSHSLGCVHIYNSHKENNVEKVTRNSSTKKIIIGTAHFSFRTSKLIL